MFFTSSNIADGYKINTKIKVEIEFGAENHKYNFEEI